MNAADAWDDAVIVAIGGNQPWNGADSQNVLEAALARFPDAGLELVKRSGWWRSLAWPDPAQPPFLNAVAIVRTELQPSATMAALLGLELAFGRQRSRANAPRTVDLDLIAYGRRVLQTPDLTLPHPRAAERLFVMGPLAQIAPGWRHPVSNRCATSLADAATVGLDAQPLVQG